MGEAKTYLYLYLYVEIKVSRLKEVYAANRHE